MSKRAIADKVWAGTEASLQEWMELQTTGAELRADMYSPEDDEDIPYLLSVQNGVGVININGPLTNRESPWNAYLGVASYGAIQEALVYAAESPDVQSILLNINSGGGPVNGVGDTSNLISLIDSKVKPIEAYTGGRMMSAAYWLGCSARSITVANVAEVGSIGVIATHMEESKALKDAGINVTVMRAGKYKALANSMEPLTDAAKAEIQSSLDAVYKIFVQHVASARNQPYDYADQTMAQGREFLGEQALSAGLVDQVASLSDVLSRMEASTLDNTFQSGQTMQNSMYGANNMKKKALSDQEIAALAAGGSLTEPDAPNQVTTQEPAEASATDAVTTEAAADPADQVTESQQETQASVVSFLQAQVREKDQGLLDAHVRIHGLEAQVAEQSDTFSELVAIAAQSINNMRIALGGSAIDMAGKGAVAVLAEHKSLREQFESKFKAGGVAAVSAESESETGPSVNQMTQAIIAANTGKTSR